MKASRRESVTSPRHRREGSGQGYGVAAGSEQQALSTGSPPPTESQPLTQGYFKKFMEKWD